jgi:MtrB/PioB family decaheme-associated outer membrane protein
MTVLRAPISRIGRVGTAPARRRSWRLAALLAAGLVPVAAAAQDDFNLEGAPPAKPPEPVYTNSLSLGVGYQAGDSFKFGRFTGLNRSGAFGIGDMTLRGRDPWDSGGTRYWDFEAANVGLDSKSANLRYGFQGNWGLRLEYDGIPYNESHHFSTIYDGSGKGTLNGAPVAAAPQNGSAGLARFLNDQQLSTQRDKFGAGFTYDAVPNWKFTTNVEHENKTGAMEQAMLFAVGKNALPQGGPAPTAAQGNIVYFPQPIDYDTDRYEVKLAYNGAQLQGELGYVYSSFTDNMQSFNGFDPFQSPCIQPATCVTVGNTSANGGPAGTPIRAAYSLPPSNSEHSIRASLGYNVDPTTRIVGNFIYSLGYQNAGYAPDTNNPFVQNVTGLSRHPGSLDADMESVFGNVTLTARPLPKLDVRASLTSDNRVNDGTSQVYQATYDDTLRPYAGVGGIQGAVTNAGIIGNPTAFGARNFLFSNHVLTAKVDAGYRLLPKTKFTVGYEFKDVKRNNLEIDHSKENTFSARLDSGIGWGVNGSLYYAHSYREANSYDPNRPWTYLGFGIGDNIGPMFYQESRFRDEIKGRVNGNVSDALDLGFQTRFTNDRYKPPLVNSAATFANYLTSDNTLSVGPDLTFTPTHDLAANLFYNFELINRDDQGATANIGTLGNFGKWSQHTLEEVHTFGANGTWNAVPDKLKIGFGYNFSYGNASWILSDGFTPALVSTFSAANQIAAQNFLIQNLPNQKSTLHSISINGEYAFTPQLSLWFGYTFERFIYNDFAFEAQSNPIQYANALLGGLPNPSYSVHLFGTAMHFRF